MEEDLKNQEDVSGEKEEMSSDSPIVSVENSEEPALEEEGAKNKKAVLIITLLVVAFVLAVAFVLFRFSMVEKTPMSSDTSMKEPKNMTQVSAGWGEVMSGNIEADQEFELNVYVDSQGKELGAFSFDLKFDPSLATINTSKGAEGIDKADDSSNFMVMANPNDISNGFYKFSGICAQNCGSGKDMFVAKLHMKALASIDTEKFDYELELMELSDSMGKSLKLIK